ncbi:hypothetical protein HZB89_02385 [archaeon]|nr:hypothetical protein [archaeon]
MELKIIDEKKNSLLKRHELDFELTQKTMPSRKELAEEIAEMKKANKNQVAVGKFEALHGTGRIAGKANVYESEEALRKTEPKYLIEKHFGKKEENKEEKKPEAAEAKKEGKKEGEK